MCEGIAGRKVVIVDACHSGNLIQDGGAEDAKVAFLNAEAVLDAEKVHARQGDGDGEPEKPGRAFAKEKAEKRHEEDVLGRDEARLSGRRSREADLLEERRGREDRAADKASDDEVAPPPARGELAGGAGAAKRENDGKKRQASDEAPHAVEGIGAVEVHPDPLRHEGAAPDQGGEHHQEVVFEIREHGNDPDRSKKQLYQSAIRF